MYCECRFFWGKNCFDDLIPYSFCFTGQTLNEKTYFLVFSYSNNQTYICVTPAYVQLTQIIVYHMLMSNNYISYNTNELTSLVTLNNKSFFKHCIK